jgi:hypothetical protein
VLLLAAVIAVALGEWADAAAILAIVLVNGLIGFVQEELSAFRLLAEQHAVSLISATHYGSERPPQLAMLDWFLSRGIPAKFIENGPK